jgi:hypothetical protein
MFRHPVLTADHLQWSHYLPLVLPPAPRLASIPIEYLAESVACPDQWCWLESQSPLLDNEPQFQVVVLELKMVQVSPAHHPEELVVVTHSGHSEQLVKAVDLEFYPADILCQDKKSL